MQVITVTNGGKIIHTESSFKELLIESGCKMIDGNSYEMPNGEVRYYKIVSQTRCGIDGIMNHICISRTPITIADENATILDWNNGR